MRDLSINSEGRMVVAGDLEKEMKGWSWGTKFRFYKTKS